MQGMELPWLVLTGLISAPVPAKSTLASRPARMELSISPQKTLA